MRNQKGITLIALVITIIVLLILAGVSIAMLTNDEGLLGKATDAGKETKIAEQREMASLDAADLIAEYYQKKYVDNDTMNQTVADYVKASMPTNSLYYDYDPANGTITLKEKDKDGNSITGTIQSDGKIDWPTTSSSGTQGS